MITGRISARKAALKVKRFPDRLGVLDNRDGSRPVFPACRMLVRRNKESRKARQILRIVE